MNRFSSLAILALAFVAACDKDLRAPTTPPPSPDGITKSISDGAHEGNPNFFFLVPSLPPTSGLGTFKLGTFNSKLAPEVVICRLDVASGAFPTDNSLCASQTADLTFPTDVHVVTTPATTFESGLQKTYTLPADGFYYSTWKTKGLNLSGGKFYRIQVKIGSLQLGFVDITPEPIGTGIFTLYKVVTHEVVPTLQDGTVPIVFRIQNGATCYPVASCAEGTVTNTGNTTLNGIPGTFVTAPSGNSDGKDGAKAFFPEGFLTGLHDLAGNPLTSIVVTIKKVTPTVAEDCHNPVTNPQLLQFLNCYEFSVSPMPREPWATPVRVSTCPNLQSTSALGSLTQLWASDNDLAARPLAPALMPIECGSGSFGQIGMIHSSNPLLRLAGNAVGAVEKGLSRVFAPRTAYAWDVGVGGLDAGPGFSKIGWGMVPVVALQVPQSAGTSSVIAVTAKVTTDHDLGSEAARLNQTVAGLPVTFSVKGGTLSANANGTGGLPTLTATTNSDGNAVVYLNVAAGVNTITASVLDGTNPVATAVAAVAGVTFGQIRGAVLDAAGAVLPGVTVTAVNEETEQQQQATTNSDGSYLIQGLELGTYTVRANAVGVSAVSQSGVAVTGADPVTVNLTFALSTPSPVSPENLSVFDFFPRTTPLSWSAVPGAVSYQLGRSYCESWQLPDYASTCTVWTDYPVADVVGTNFTFDFVGAQPGRWRVRAVFSDDSTGPWSDYRYFRYLQ